MALERGTRLGQYEIAGLIGAGGMGEVYRAADTKLGREVAIKTLPSAMAADADRLARFEREAKLLAALNHAYIGTIYGLEEHEGIRFIAMELVEGQTLEEKLKDGALPVKDALRIALQIAEALEAAHHKGVVHRDLKPANIMLTSDGVVKVLDFGLAKAFSGDPDTASPAHSPAVSLAMTQQGLLLGTAGYMSPEQASGQATDQRADIWAFGVLLYEMLAGLPLFAGESMPHILADILRTEPDWSRLPQNLHPRLRLLLERCLEKNVRDRYHSIADVRVDIEKVLADPSGVSQPASTIASSAQPLWRRLLPTTGLVAVAVVITAIAVRFATRPEPRPVNRFEHQLPVGQTFRFSEYNVLACSRDGRSIAYNAADGIYLRSMDELEARLIPGTAGQIAGLELSPDGRSIVFVTPGDYLNRMSIGGGTPVVYDAGPGGAYLSFDFAEWILYRGGGIRRVPADGGVPELIVPHTEGEEIISHRLLPDRDSVLFSVTRTGSADDAQVFAQSISTGERTLLVSSGADARYVPSGHLVYALQDGLYAVAFDLETLTVSGVPVQVAQGVMRSSDPSGSANYCISDDGTLVYMSGASATEDRRLLWVDREHNEEPITAPPRQYQSPRLSPNGDKIALSALDEDADIWIWDLDGARLRRLTFDPGRDRWPLWYNDQRLVYLPDEGANVWLAADGSGAPEPLEVDDRESGFPASFVPDGTGLVVFGGRGGGSDDIAHVPLDGVGEIRVLLDGPADERLPEISPDGRWLAYISNETGRDEVYVRPFPDVRSGGPWQISAEGGTEPLWARNPDELELFFRRNGAVVGVQIQTDSGFSHSNPEVIFDGPYSEEINGGRSYDISPDGQRFLMLATVADPSAAPRIVIVQNWVEELKRLVPTE